MSTPHHRVTIVSLRGGRSICSNVRARVSGARAQDHAFTVWRQPYSFAR